MSKSPKKQSAQVTKARVRTASALSRASRARKSNKKLRELLRSPSPWSPGGMKLITEFERAPTAAERENARIVQTTGAKASNPKDALGIRKVPYSTISQPVLAELGVAMLEGALKYGRHNYRAIGVKASVYFDAEAARHMALWWEGEDIDPDSGMSHVTKAIASLCVLRDAMIQGKMIDDRPPKSPAGWMDELNKKVAALLVKYPNPVAPYIEGDERMKPDGHDT